MEDLKKIPLRLSNYEIERRQHSCIYSMISNLKEQLDERQCRYLYEYLKKYNKILFEYYAKEVPTNNENLAFKIDKMGIYYTYIIDGNIINGFLKMMNEFKTMDNYPYSLICFINNSNENRYRFDAHGNIYNNYELLLRKNISYNDIYNIQLFATNDNEFDDLMKIMVNLSTDNLKEKFLNYLSPIKREDYPVQPDLKKYLETFNTYDEKELILDIILEMKDYITNNFLEPTVTKESVNEEYREPIYSYTSEQRESAYSEGTFQGYQTRVRKVYREITNYHENEATLVNNLLVSMITMLKVKMSNLIESKEIFMQMINLYNTEIEKQFYSAFLTITFDNIEKFYKKNKKVRKKI